MNVELAVNQYGQRFTVPDNATHWLVRRMSDAPRGGPQRTFGHDGRPVTLPIDATLDQFHAHLEAVGCAAGKYRLDPVDNEAQPAGPPAYLLYPPRSRGASVGGVGPAGPGPAMAMPPMAAPPPFSTGAFPLPVPMGMTPELYVLAETIRAMTQMMTQMNGNVMSSVADLVRAVDGAGVGRRKVARVDEPAPAPPRVVVQQVPVPYYAPPEDEDDDEDEEPTPAPEPTWKDKIGEAILQAAPLAQAAIQSWAQRGNDVAPEDEPSEVTAPPAPPAPPPPPAPPALRNAADTTAALDPERLLPAAWSHVGSVARRIGPEWKARLDAMLAAMPQVARNRFALSLMTKPLDQACDAVIGRLAVLDARRARQGGASTGPVAASAAPIAAPADAVAAPTVGSTVGSSTTAPGALDPHAPTAADLTEVRAAYLARLDADATQGIVAGAYSAAASTDTHAPTDHADSATPTTVATPADGDTPAVGATPAVPTTGLEKLYANLAETTPFLRRIPGGAATVQAATLALIGPEGLEEIERAIASVPRPSSFLGVASAASGLLGGTNLSALGPVLGGTSAAARPPIAPATPAPVPPAVAIARMNEILPHLTPAERQAAQALAMRLPASERNGLLSTLVAAPLPQAVALVRAALAQRRAA